MQTQAPRLVTSSTLAPITTTLVGPMTNTTLNQKIYYRPALLLYSQTSSLVLDSQPQPANQLGSQLSSFR